MDKQQFTKLWFLTFLLLGGLTFIVYVVSGDFKTGLIAFAACLIVAVIVWVYINELLWKKGAKSIIDKTLHPEQK